MEPEDFGGDEYAPITEEESALERERRGRLERGEPLIIPSIKMESVRRVIGSSQAHVPSQMGPKDLGDTVLSEDLATLQEAFKRGKKRAERRHSALARDVYSIVYPLLLNEAESGKNSLFCQLEDIGKRLSELRERPRPWPEHGGVSISLMDIARAAPVISLFMADLGLEAKYNVSTSTFVFSFYVPEEEEEEQF